MKGKRTDSHHMRMKRINIMKDSKPYPSSTRFWFDYYGKNPSQEAARRVRYGIITMAEWDA